jgi:hypothetical protein
MERKLIISPAEQVWLYGYQAGLNQSPYYQKELPVDVPHFFFSAITMAGADSIQSMLPLEETSTTLIKKIVKKPLIKEWANCLVNVEENFKMYPLPQMSKKLETEFFLLKHTVLQLLFAMKSNSSVLLLSDLQSIKNTSKIPPELTMPFELLFSSIQSKNAQLPIVKYDLPKKDVRKLLEILGSKEFETYKEAQSEIEKNKNLTSKTINSIEAAGKDLYRVNKKYLTLKESVVKAVPLSPKVIELYFGKLPGVLVEFASKILLDYLGINNTIPIYSADSISFLLKSRLENS